MRRTIVVTFLLFAGCATAQQLSVTSCGADPTGVQDSTYAFKACFAKLPAGDLLVPVGSYRITSPIFKTRNQGLVGLGSKASILLCQNQTEPCIIAADTTGGPNNYAVSNIRNLGLQGTGSGIGILLGGDPANVLIANNAFGDSVDLVDLRITGFTHGVQWGNNAYINKIERCLIYANVSGLYVPSGVSNSGEAISVTDSTIFNNTNYGIEDHGNFEWFIHGASLDYNAWAAILFYGAAVHISNTHVDQEGATVISQPYGYGTLSIKDSTILIQATTGYDQYVLSTWPQSLILSIDNLNIYSNHPVSYFMRVQGTVSGTITNLYGNGNRKIGSLSNAPGSEILTGISAF
jgi:hypothetical protein